VKIIATFLKSASLWAMIGIVLRVGSSLFTLPLALRVLSPNELGLYYTFLSITGLVMLLDFGFAQSINRSAAFAMGGAKEFQATGIPEKINSSEPNWKLLGELLAAVQIWYRSIGVVLLLVMLIPGSYFILSLLDTSGLSRNYLYCWWLFAAVTAFSFVTTYWPSLLYGIGSVKSAAKAGIISQAIGITILITCLLYDCGLWSYGFSSLISVILSLFLTKKAFFKDASAALLNKVDRYRRNKILFCLWPMVWRQGIVMLGAYFIQRGNTLTCTQKLGLEETSSYGLSLNLFNLLFQVIIIPLSLAWPIIGRLRVERNFAAIRRIFYVRLYSGLAFAALIIFVMMFYGNSILGLIGAQSLLLPSPVLLCLGTVLWLECHHSQYGGLVLSENQNPFLWPALLSGIAIFFISRWAVGIWGILGMILTQGIVQLVWNNWWTVLRGIKGLK
jgi:O-antigen/teichoic acid export membrane protein